MSSDERDWEVVAPSAETPSETRPEAGFEPAIGGESDDPQAYVQRLRLAEEQTATVLAAFAELKHGKGKEEERISAEVEQRYSRRRDNLLMASLGILAKLDEAIVVARQTETAQSLVEGLQLVRSLLHRNIKDEGVEHVSVLGLPVDKDLCTIVGTRPVDDPARHDVVLEEVQRALKIEARLARPAAVIVGVYEERPAGVAEPEPIPPAPEATGFALVSPAEPPAPPESPPQEPAAAAPTPAVETSELEPAPAAEAEPITPTEATGFALVAPVEAPPPVPTEPPVPT